MNANEMIHIANTYLPGCSDALEQLLACSAAQREEPIVVVYGVYNAGKSSLLNSLTGHVEQEYFATRDIPETKKNKTLVHGGLCFLDTPGLDVNAEDTRAAMDGGRQADLIMLVHKLGAGSIQKQDLQAMQKLVAAHGKQVQVIAVLTEGETASQNQQLIKEITQQLDSVVPDCSLFVVSNTSFRKGVREGKQALVYHSGIPQLLEALQTKKRALTAALERSRATKKTELKSQLLDALGARQNSVEMLQELEQTAQVWYEHECIAAVQGIQLKLLETGLEEMLTQLDD